MSKEEFLLLMRFPAEWLHWGMYPDALATIQIAGYQSGHEAAPEHDRNGAFHWWIVQNPDEKIISCLIRLAFLDPDRQMGGDALEFLRRCENFGPDHERLISDLCGVAFK